MPNVAMLHEQDPKLEILNKLGDALKGFQILNNEVLVATYLRPEKTAGSIVLTQKTRDEDLYQSKCGLVVAIGAAAEFPLIEVKLHDWVMIRPSDGLACEILTKNEPVHCRMIFDKHIRAKMRDPWLVW
jgi:co-chaperonin GroES (HSP10)